MHISLDAALQRQPLLSTVGDKLLPTFPGAAAAYSLRALNGDANNVVRVRRASDNSEKDFTALQISSGELVDWVGASNDGFVETWYDQSGNDNHATQDYVDDDQPKIVSAGSYLGALKFDGSNDYLEADSLASDLSGDDNNIDTFSVAKSESTSGATAIFALGNSGGSASQLHYFGSIGTQYRIISRDDNSVISIADGGTFGSKSLLSGIDNGNSLDIRANGTSVATDTDDKGQRTFNKASVGAWARGGTVSAFFEGTVSELIVYNSDQSANRTAIESNIADEYGITLS